MRGPRNKIDMAARRERNRQIIRQMKTDVPCADCLHHYPWYVMEFDHIGPKKRNVNTAGSTGGMLDEIDKCEIVCANCHKVRTHVRRIDGD